MIDSSKILLSLENFKKIQSKINELEERFKFFEETVKKSDVDNTDSMENINNQHSFSKKLHPPSAEDNSFSFKSDKLEVQRMLIEKDYKEIHSFVKKGMKQGKKLNKYFKMKISMLNNLKATNEMIKELNKSKTEKNSSDTEKMNEELLYGIVPEDEPSEESESSSCISSTSSQEDCSNNSEHFEDLKKNVNISEQDVEQYKKLHFNEMRKGVLDVKITQKDKEELLEYTKAGPVYSESVKKQNKKILEIYNNYCKQMKLKPFPVTAVTAVSFIHHLSKTEDIV